MRVGPICNLRLPAPLHNKYILMVEDAEVVLKKREELTLESVLYFVESEGKPMFLQILRYLPMIRYLTPNSICVCHYALCSLCYFYS